MYILTTIIIYAFTLSVATATVSVNTIPFVYILTTIIFSVLTLSVATAIVSVDTIEFGQPNKNHHFKMFALSVATATINVNTIYLFQNISRQMLSSFSLAVSVIEASSSESRLITTGSGHVTHPIAQQFISMTQNVYTFSMIARWHHRCISI